MTVAQARSFIETFTRASTFPTLSTADVDALLSLARRADSANAAPDTYTEWVASAVVVVNTKVTPTTRNGHYYKATVAGTAGATEPTWPTASGATVVDGGVTWTEQGAAPWVPSWNLPHAVAKGWELKAGSMAGAYDLSTGAQKLSRSQVHKQCLEMAKAWQKRSFETVKLIGSLQAQAIAQGVVESNATADCGCGWWDCGSCRSSFAWPTWDSWLGWYGSYRC